jgi:hypothetical protein
MHVTTVLTITNLMQENLIMDNAGPSESSTYHPELKQDGKKVLLNQKRTVHTLYQVEIK